MGASAMTDARRRTGDAHDPRRRRLRRLGPLLGDTRRRLRADDLALASAASTLYGALAVGPSLLVAIAVAQLVIGRSAVEDYGDRLAGTLPTAMGAAGAMRQLIEAGLTLTPIGVVFAIVMGSAYGGGLSRSLVRFAPVPDDARPPAWWLRAATLPLLGLAPLMLSGLLAATPWLAGINARSGLQGRALASYLSLTLVWVLTWLPLTWTFRVVGPGHPSWRASAIGAVVTGAFVSGFIQGFLVFLALPVDLARPFGGLLGVGVVSVLLLWLWVLHVVVLIGYAFTWAVDAELRPR
jgi:membrane protein